MLTEPQSGRSSQSTSNIYHQHKDLHKMQQWHNRNFMSSIFLYLEGFKSTFPITAALDIKLPLCRAQQGGTGIMKPYSPSYNTTPEFPANSLCLVQKLSHKDSYHPLYPSSLTCCALQGTRGQFQQDRRVRAHRADGSTEPASFTS